MADEQNVVTPAADAAATAAAAKPKTVAEDMAPRRIFPNIAEAVAYLKATATAIPDFKEQTIAAPKMDENGNFDSATYGEGVAVMVALLRNRQKVKAIVVAPIPTLDQLLANEAGKAWVDRIIAKELNHVAVRHLREAEDVTTVVDQIPTTMDAYITSQRDGGGGIMETFDELYKLINATLSAKLPVWNKARFIKSELKKSLESKGYASEYSPQLEDYKGESLFVTALNLGINAAKRKGLDPTIFERWLATRDAKAFVPGETDDDDELDLDSLTDSLLADAAKADEPTTPAPDGAASAEPETPAEPEAPAEPVTA